ncbi:hypothetical protein [Facklamia sp. P9177]|uniref:hypothetical protein n=1 Tax=Facklamia sp. P9177 TaxID=3421945 RepID=UPI003D164B68
MTKQIFAKSVSKVIPLIGAVLSGGLTYATFTPMAERLRNYLATNNLANVHYYEPFKEDVMVEIKDGEFIDNLDEAEELTKKE